MKIKWVYWASTALLAMLYVAGGTMYLSNIAGIQQAFAKLGYPAYLVPILAVVKLAGAITVVWRFNRALTDLAYAGMFYHLLLAFSAHINAGDGGFVPAIVGLIALLISFFTQNAARAKPSPYGSWALVRSA
ncbi:DoxX family protein [Variovorax sp.]|uniref:DoxX family protein n=1 Tax=Variovorax sp. TaxID=1871043 RepID=UPI002D4CB063|nr:DoxX family protein [Variovorax sp.]HYP85359.1 DoxX family protein [Variovorax sp.]